MQLFSKDSPNPLLRVEMPLNDAAEEKASAAPLMSNVANTAIKPQTINCDASSQQSRTAESVGNNRLLSALLGGELSLEQKLQEEKLIFVLENIFEVENLFYDDKTLFSLTINDYPKKFFYLKLMTSALYAKAALYSVKSRVLNLIRSIPKNKKQNVSQGRIALGVAITHLIKNKLIHQKCLDRILSNNFGEIPEGINIEEMQKFNAGTRAEIRKLKHRLCEYRRAYDESIRLSDVPEKDVLENISYFLSEDYLAFTIRKIFPSLSIPNVKKLINTYIPMPCTTSKMERAVSAATAADVMEKNEFKLIRAPVPRVFWESLDTKLNKVEFNKKLFLFLLTSWQSDDSTKLKMNRDLVSAQDNNELITEYKILSNKLFQQKFNLNGFKIVNCICQLANNYQRIMTHNRFGNKDKFKLKKEMISLVNELNNVYLSIYENDYQLYLNAKEIKLEEVTCCNLIIKIENVNEELNKIYECKHKARIKRYAKKYTQFVYHVLLHFKENTSIDYLCVESIAKQIMSNPLKMREDKAESEASFNNKSYAKQANAQSAVRKREKTQEHKQIQLESISVSPSAIITEHLETTSASFLQSKRFRSSTALNDQLPSFQEIKSTTVESDLSASLGEIVPLPIDAMIADLAGSPIAANELIGTFAEESLGIDLQQNQLVDSFESALPIERKTQQNEQAHDSFALALQKVEEDVKNIISTDVKSQYQLVDAKEYWQILGSLISDESSSSSTNIAISQLVEAKRMEVAKQHSQKTPNTSSNDKNLATSGNFEQPKLRFEIQNFDGSEDQNTFSSCALNFKPQLLDTQRIVNSQQTIEQVAPSQSTLMIEDSQLTELFPNLSSLLSLNDVQAEFNLETHLDLPSKHFDW